MAKSTSKAIWSVALLASLMILGGLAWCQVVRAEGPLGGMNEALRARLQGLVNGLWVGQVDPRAFAMPGEEIEYLLYYENNGATVSNATLVDILPLWCELKPDSVDPEPYCAWQYDEVNRRLEFTLGSLAEHKGGVVRLRATVQTDVPARTPLMNKAQAWVGNEMTDESLSAPTVVQAPQLEVAVQAPTRIQRCSDMAYTLVCSNTGNTGALWVTAVMTLPDGFDFLRVAPEDTKPQQQGGVLTWRYLPDIPVDGVLTLTVFARVSQRTATWPGTYATCEATVRTHLPSRVARETHGVATRAIEPGSCPLLLVLLFRYQSTYADSYEPDTVPQQATAMEVDGPPTEHTFHRPGDEDWMRFLASPYVTYQVETYDLVGAVPPGGAPDPAWEPRTDTVMSVYEPQIDPLSPFITGTLVCESDNWRQNPPDYRSVCCFRATTHGWYFIRVQQHNPLIGGAGTGYKVRVRRVGGCP